MERKKPTKKQIEALAKEIRQYLLDNNLWIDCTIYFNGKAFATDDRHGNYYYNDPVHLVVLEDQDPHRVCEYVGDILTMTFEGPLYSCLNLYGEYNWSFESRIYEEFPKIFEKYGVYFELGNEWNLTAYPL